MKDPPVFMPAIITPVLDLIGISENVVWADMP